ncbi:MAG: hypothetical protein SCALA702_14480 [Melioribacteraceae bacterium]|nr:MAG: hypothetical protein SCALA702_14480 [Melioribacteraceae bacterium]
MRIKKFIIILLLTSSVVFGFEKVGTTSFQFLKVMTTARAYALAGAYTTVANTSDAVFWNPAGLTQIKHFGVSAGYTEWIMDIGHYSFSGAYTVEGVGTFAAFAMFNDIGEIQETQVSALGFVNGKYNPGLTGRTFSPSSMVAGISFARDLNDRFTFGINVKYAREDLVYESAGVIAFDGGLIYNTGFKSIILGATIRNFGPEVEFIDRSYPLPQTLTLGLSTMLFSRYDPLLMNLGAHSLLVTYAMEQPRDYDQQHIIGMEYGFDEMLYLRGGYRFNGDQEGLSFGGGVLFHGYKIDYAFSDFGEHLSSVHRISLGINVN